MGLKRVDFAARTSRDMEVGFKELEDVSGEDATEKWRVILES